VKTALIRYTDPTHAPPWFLSLCLLQNYCTYVLRN